MNLRIKRKSFSGRGITFVGVSDWIKERALNSDVLKGENVVTVHNPLDTGLFKPMEDIRDIYGTGNKKLILFGAVKATSNKTKGFDHLLEALKGIEGNNCCAVCFGNAPAESRVSPITWR